MKMSERIERIIEIRKEIDKLNNSVKRDRVEKINNLSIKLKKLNNISLENIPEYFRFKGDNIEELNLFFKDFTLWDGTIPTFILDIHPDGEPVAYCENKPFWLHLGQVISKEDNQVRLIENEEIDLIHHILSLKGTEEKRKVFYKNIYSSLSFTDTKYKNIKTEENISAIQWTGNNHIEILDFIKPFFFIDMWRDKDENLCLVYKDTHEEFILKKNDYLIQMSNPLYGIDTKNICLNFGEESKALIIRPSKQPFFIYDVMSEEKFHNQYRKEYEIEKTEEEQERE